MHAVQYSTIKICIAHSVRL